MSKIKWFRPGFPLLPVVPVALLAGLCGASGASAQCVSCVNAITLPSTPVLFSSLPIDLNAASDLATAVPAIGYFTITLTGVAPGTSLGNQSYPAWCAGWFNSGIGNSVGSQVYSTYKNFPASAGPNFNGNTINEVNYILNHKIGTVQDVQDAIWLVMTGTSGDTPSTSATSMVTGAEANPGYVPNAGGIMAVYYQSGPITLPATSALAALQLQSLFIEVPVPNVTQQNGCSGCVTSITLPAGVVTNSSLTLNFNAATQPDTQAGYFNLTLSGIGSGFSIANQTYKAWCLGWFNSGVGNLPGTVANTLTSAFPAAEGPLGTNTINEINYILNNKPAGGVVQDIQDAIWIIMTGTSGDTPSAITTALVAAAKQNPNYCPPAGGVIGIVYQIGASTLPTSSSAASAALQNILFEVQCTGTTSGGGTPALSLRKTANVAKCNPFQKVTYTYVVTNTGTVPLSGIVVTDDNGTPGYTKDDFTVGTIAGPLTPGASATLTASVYPPVTESANADEGWGVGWGWSQANWSFDYDHQIPGGTLICKDQGNGKIQFTYRESTSLTDNTYGSNSSWDWGWWGHSFSSFAEKDGAEFQVLDSTGKCVLDFVADYISPNSSYKSGWGTNGVKGNGGYVYAGNAANVLRVDTSLSHNINSQQKYFQCTQNSPPQGTKDWDFDYSYTITVDAGAACGSKGFGGIKCPVTSNNPSKNWSCNNVVSKPVSSTVTNTAVAAVVYNGATVKAQATATVQIDASPQGWSQCGKY